MAKVSSAVSYGMLFFTSNLSLAAFSQPGKVAMAALVVEGSEPCQWHAVSQVCHICGTCPELEVKTWPSSAALLWMAAVKTVKYDAVCVYFSVWRPPVVTADDLVTVFGQKRVKEGRHQWGLVERYQIVSWTDRMRSFFYPVWAPVKCV